MSYRLDGKEHEQHLTCQFNRDRKIVTEGRYQPFSDISVVNAIRSSVFRNSACYSFTNIEKIFYPEREIPTYILNDRTKTHLNRIDPKFKLQEQERSHFVLESTAGNIETLSKRVERLPIYYSNTTMRFLDGVSFVFSKDQDELAMPYVHEMDKPLDIYARDLVPINDEDGEIIDKIDTSKFFPLNTRLLRIRKGEKIHIAAKPVLTYGFINSNSYPCHIRYRYCSASGEREADSTRRDRFGNPEGLKLVIEENGKKHPVFALYDGLSSMEFMLRQLLGEYEKPPPEEGAERPVVHINGLDDPRDHFVIYNNRNPDTNVLVNDLTSPSFGNMIACHILYYVHDKIVDRVGASGEEYNKLLQETSISYKKPHPNERIDRSIIYTKIPSSLELDTGNVVEIVLNGLIAYIKAIQHNLLEEFAEHVPESMIGAADKMMAAEAKRAEDVTTAGEGVLS